MSLSEFPFKVTIERRVWSPGVSHWLKNSVGAGNYQYRKGSDNYSYLRYVFRNEEDATAFKIKFG